MSAEYLADAARGLLAAAQAALVESSTGHAAPTVAFLSHGAPVADRCCDGQLSVHLLSLTHNQPFTVDENQGCGVTPRPTFVITLYRCVPMPQDDGVPPAPAVLSDSAEGLQIDLWCLMTELYDRRYNCTLIPGLECDGITFEDVESLAPEGGCAGWAIRVSIDTNDSGPLGS